MNLRDITISLREDERLLYAIRTLYRQYGYRYFRMSKFEKYELYAGFKDFLVSDRVITFNDTDGELLALKPDVTLSIVKGTRYQAGYKDKLCYQENVYRPSGSSRQFREIMQAGLECIGDLDLYDVAEVLMLADKSMKLISEDSVLCASHIGILKDICAALQTKEAEQNELLTLVSQRNLHGLDALFCRHEWDRDILDAIHWLLEINCALRDLPAELESYRQTWPGRKAMMELGKMAALSMGDARFDFSVINDVHYYNGIVFQGFVRGVSEKVLSGGQYDSLLRRMNRKGAAIGFAVYFGVLEQLAAEETENDADVLLLYSEHTDLTDLRNEVARLHSENRSVFTQRVSGKFEVPIHRRYGEIRDMRGGAAHA